MNNKCRWCGFPIDDMYLKNKKEYERTCPKHPYNRLHLDSFHLPSYFIGAAVTIIIALIIRSLV